MAVSPVVRIEAADFDISAEVEAVSEGRPGIGAVVAFAGLCRDEGGRLAGLELEHYPGMAEAEIRRAAMEACARWPLAGVTVIHRFGLIPPGGRIVLTVTASAHRGAAFEAGEFLMDYLKTRAPFWKREHLRDGTKGPWVEAKGEDDRAADRWGSAKPFP